MIDFDAIVDAIADRVVERMPAGPVSPWLTTEEAAEYLRVSRTWLWERREQIPCSKVDGKLFFNRNELDIWITNHRREI